MICYPALKCEQSVFALSKDEPAGEGVRVQKSDGDSWSI